MWLLIAASLVFYAAWSIPFTGLIVLSAVLDYGASLGIHRARAPRWKNAIAVASSSSRYASESNCTVTGSRDR